MSARRLASAGILSLRIAGILSLLLLMNLSAGLVREDVAWILSPHGPPGSGNASRALTAGAVLATSVWLAFLLGGRTRPGEAWDSLRAGIREGRATRGVAFALLVGFTAASAAAFGAYHFWT